jgi:hypothetical protein
LGRTSAEATRKSTLVHFERVNSDRIKPIAVRDAGRRRRKPKGAAHRQHGSTARRAQPDAAAHEAPSGELLFD